MKKSLVVSFAIYLIIGTAAMAQDLPRSCQNPVSPFDDVMKGKIVSQARSAHSYFMNSSDAAAGTTYEQRSANFNAAMTKTFQEFMRVRRNEYRATICNYYKTDWNKPGKRSNRTLTVQPGFYLLQETLKRTTNGDWKGGPTWTTNSVTWTTGGHRSSSTFVDINAKYQENYIVQAVIDELNIARKELNSLGIPTEVPPFLD